MKVTSPLSPKDKVQPLTSTENLARSQSRTNKSPHGGLSKQFRAYVHIFSLLLLRLTVAIMTSWLLAGLALHILAHLGSPIMCDSGWRPKKEYKFLVEGRSISTFDSLKSDSTGIHFRGQLRIQTISYNSILLRAASCEGRVESDAESTSRVAGTNDAWRTVSTTHTISDADVQLALRLIGTVQRQCEPDCTNMVPGVESAGGTALVPSVDKHSRWMECSVDEALSKRALTLAVGPHGVSRDRTIRQARPSSGIHLILSLLDGPRSRSRVFMGLNCACFHNMTYTKLHTELKDGWWGDIPTSEQAYRTLPITGSSIRAILDRAGLLNGFTYTPKCSPGDRDLDPDNWAKPSGPRQLDAANWAPKLSWHPVVLAPSCPGTHFAHTQLAAFGWRRPDGSAQLS
uniref:Uncharacterized protein n=1 Tax=Timema shepardi TaxID=629360 RepID=A0A7R9AKB2_TIMSH|nr:unnamed protein product [Timema shepardi]